MAASHGDMNAEVLYTRVHSSCVTSETMRSLDCDCVLQLEGALKKIVEEKNGILFYLIQEGRGCGYVGKSRACMIEQFTNGKCDTFAAYDYLGMKKDYREYNAIKDILKIFNINPKFVLLTNNPDKINAMKSMNINVISTAEIEFKPNPFNQSYLKAKAKSGHLLL
jgi:3,4-dihydroxy 2-butanone 4-phosphate synthase/GTP cyclohydrolase II